VAEKKKTMRREARARAKVLLPPRDNQIVKGTGRLFVSKHL
jgi:hypothetical protein